MSIEKIKKTIWESDEYSFLKTNPNINGNLIYLALSGSYACGTNVETSDIDLKGVSVETKKVLYGLDEFKHYDDEATDTTIYSLKSTIEKLMKCDPNVLQLFGVRDEHVIYSNKCGDILKKNVNLFLSNKVIETFGGYATQQLIRLENYLARNSESNIKIQQAAVNTIERQLRTLEGRYRAITPGYIKVYMDKSDKTDVDEEIYMDMDINLKHYPLKDFKNIYSEMNSTVNNFNKAGARNKKKDDLHLFKHVMTLIRCICMGIDILEGKGIITYRDKEKELLLDIRNGKYTINELFTISDEYITKFGDAAKYSKLPDKIDDKKINDLISNIYDIHLNMTN